jgi:topoisomerase-4 subunit A
MMADNKISLLEFSEKALKEYGSYVIEQRAIPDFRDGLKPVHRCALWAMYKLGIDSKAKYRKAALAVGEAIGRYHPHGDSSVYSAMVGLAGVIKQKKGNKVWETKNVNVPLIEGFGNWGDNIDNAAAYRYTECRLSEFADKLLLDQNYLAVTPLVPNYDDTTVQPLYLPAKLPVVLLNGSESIAVGIACSTPAFAPKGVVSLVIQELEGTPVTPNDCVENLKFSPTYGGTCTSSKKERLSFFKTGKATLKFMPSIEIDEGKKTVTLTSFAPGLTSSNSLATLTKNLVELKSVKTVYDESDDTGFRLSVLARSGAEFAEMASAVQKILEKKCTESYNMGITVRAASNLEQEAELSFRNVTVPQLIKQWCKWRVNFEVKVVNYLIGVENKKLWKQSLLLKAINGLEVIMQALRKDDSEAYLIKHLKVTQEEASEIMSMQVRQLKSLEKTKVVAKIKEHEATIESLTKELKSPAKRVVKQLKIDVAEMF